MNRKIILHESYLNSYQQVMILAKAQLITLGGDGRDSDFGDKIQGGMLDLLEGAIDNIELVKLAKSVDIDDENVCK